LGKYIVEEKLIVAAVTDHESIEDALIACVKACGGSKVVGVALWPAKGIEAAQRYLLSCLNADRAEKLSPAEVMYVMRMARDKGCHAGMQYTAATLSYSMPIPVEPKDEADDLRRQLLEMGKRLEAGFARLEKLEQRAPTPLRAA
jgi:hypothetical protein